MRKSAKSNSQRDWAPVEKDNGVYCAPACGCGCLKVDYERCHQQAAVIQAELKELGLGDWQIRVWENGDWHWELYAEYWHLSPSEGINHELPKGHPERKTVVGWSCYTLQGPQGVSQIWERGQNYIEALHRATLRLDELAQAVKATTTAFPPAKK